MATTRKCTVCREELKITEFDIRSKGKEKRRYSCVCRDCLRKMAVGDKAFSVRDFPEANDAEELLAVALVSMVEHDVTMLTKTTLKDAIKRIGHEAVADVDFESAKKRALELVTIRKGLDLDEHVEYGPGRYLVFGQSYGRYMDDGMFRLCTNLVDFFDARPVHLGNMMDGYGHVSRITELSNLIVVPMHHEFIAVRKASEKYGFEISRDSVSLGPVMAANQNYRGENTVGSSAGIKYDEHGHRLTIVNRNSHEMHTSCSNGDPQIMWTTGCLSEAHQTKKPKSKISSKIEDLDKFDKDTSFTGRRQREVANMVWEQGCVLVDIAADGHPTVYAMRIKKVGNSYAASYYNKIITEDGVCNPDGLAFVVGDAHVDNHDPKIMATMQNIARTIRPQHVINLGDHWDMRSLNHHALDRGEPTGKCVVEEMGRGVAVLEKMGKWAPDAHVFVGNHEIWADRFAAKNPQFARLLEFSTLTGAAGTGHTIHDNKCILNLLGAVFYHGDMHMYGAKGDRHSKATKVFGKNSMCGHSHSPSIRCDAYVIGYLGLRDQGYNEPDASMWAHGFGLAVQYGGVTFLSNVPVFDYRVSVHSKECNERGWEEWVIPEYEVELIYRPKLDGEEGKDASSK